ncbi:hypothetical protein VCHA53O466_50374 [Vibrio chagasii]|nr:hypothetical protein VCHA53O466_50374 [Vibrio chagasii]
MSELECRLKRLDLVRVEIQAVRDQILTSGDSGSEYYLRTLDSSDLLLSSSILASESIENIGDHLGGNLSESLSAILLIVESLLVSARESYCEKEEELCSYLSREAALKATAIARSGGYIDNPQSFESSEFDFLFFKI